MAVSEELGDGAALLQVALRSLEERELVGGVECLVLGGSSGLIAVNDDLEVLAGHLADDSAHVDQDVSGVLGVDFLRRKRHGAKILA